ncbi:MAG: hypothetical protein V7K32_10325 [Nostoc sp.]|uniref:hypothetical protein n=1 Tax=Nostoc sp. TaxID=1180 RepID=UPI002FFBE9AA
MRQFWDIFLFGCPLPTSRPELKFRADSESPQSVDFSYETWNSFRGGIENSARFINKDMAAARLVWYSVAPQTARIWGVFTMAISRTRYYM